MTSADILVEAETEQDLQVELVRMCIAEAGYDPCSIQPYPFPASGYSFSNPNGLVPAEVCWKARELVGIGEPKCLVCTICDKGDTGFGECGADHRFSRNCRGAESGGAGPPECNGEGPSWDR